MNNNDNLNNTNNTNMFTQDNSAMPNNGITNQNVSLGSENVSTPIGGEIESLNNNSVSNAATIPQNDINSVPINSSPVQSQVVNNAQDNSTMTNPSELNSIPVQNINSSVQTPATSQPEPMPSSVGVQNQNVVPANTPVINNIPNQSTPQQPVSATKKTNNKKMIITLVISILVAIISGIITLVVINNNKPKQVNEYEVDQKEDVVEASDTIDFNGFTWL